MKIIRYSLLVLSLAALINAPADAMKRKRDTGMITLQCSHLTESIEVSETIIKHSVLLHSFFMKLPFASSYSVNVVDQETLSAVVDCLKIIDAGQEVEDKLLAYLYDFVIKYTEELERENFLNAAENLKIQQLLDCFNLFPEYYARRNANDRLNIIIQEAKDVFVAVEDKKNSAIVIDIDDTALSRAKSLGMIKMNGIETCFPYFPALNQVRDLYKQMVDFGFKIFFLTARVNTMAVDMDYHEATIENLKEEGYDVFEQVISVPREKRQQMFEDSNGDNDKFVDLHAEWKESERNKIAEKFTVVGTLDDVEENLQGSNLGHAVLIPRFS